MRIDYAHEGQKIIKDFQEALSKIHFSGDFESVVYALNGCDGRIVTTGMGKAGIIMRKLSSTLCSLGLPSVYLHPGEASHGDSGILKTDDILFVASTSGKTREILEVIDIAKRIKVKSIIGITSHIDSPIRKHADMLLDMGDVEETGYLQLAPTTSTLVMLAITDAVALTAAFAKGLTTEEPSRYSQPYFSAYSLMRPRLTSLSSFAKVSFSSSMPSGS